MLHFEGDKVFPRPPREIFDRLSDARFLGGCFLEAETITQAERDLLICTLRPGVSFVRGNLELTLRIEAVEPSAIRYHVQSKGIGSHNKVEAEVTLTAHENGTQAHWSADITELGGLLKMVPQGLIKASAQKVIDDLWAAVEGKL